MFEVILVRIANLASQYPNYVYEIKDDDEKIWLRTCQTKKSLDTSLLIKTNFTYYFKLWIVNEYQYFSIQRGLVSWQSFTHITEDEFDSVIDFVSKVNNLSLESADKIKYEISKYEKTLKSPTECAFYYKEK